jgi:hypothetical protein
MSRSAYLHISDIAGARSQILGRSDAHKTGLEHCRKLLKPLHYDKNCIFLAITKKASVTPGGPESESAAITAISHHF